jgi:hypothetical protein
MCVNGMVLGAHAGLYLDVHAILYLDAHAGLCIDAHAHASQANTNMLVHLLSHVHITTRVMHEMCILVRTFTPFIHVLVLSIHAYMHASKQTNKQFLARKYMLKRMSLSSVLYLCAQIRACILWLQKQDVCTHVCIPHVYVSCLL